MEIRPLREHDAAVYWNLRLESLQREPYAFGKAVEEHQAMKVEVFEERFRCTSDDNFTLGAFEGDKLIGLATFIREKGIKDRHKGRIYGVYVTASQRGTGLGNALMASLLKKARANSGLEQILLAVAAGQTAAIQLYRKFGFEVFGTEPRALKVGSEYIDEQHMILMLRQSGAHME
jgi:ribosomal protein S18 acetylase RimI-like enzyme